MTFMKRKLNTDICLLQVSKRWQPEVAVGKGDESSEEEGVVVAARERELLVL